MPSTRTAIPHLLHRVCVQAIYQGLLFLNLDTSDFKGSSTQAGIVFFLCTTGSILAFTSLLSDGTFQHRTDEVCR